MGAERAGEIRRRAGDTPVTAPTEVIEGVWLTGPASRETPFENTGGKSFTDVRCTQPDDLIDDQAAFLDTPAGVAVTLGCAHPGVINTLRYVRTLTAGRLIHTVIGGMHLLAAGAERMDRTVAALRDLEVPCLMPCHCTGFAAMCRLHREFPDEFAKCQVGSVVELGRQCDALRRWSYTAMRDGRDRPGLPARREGGRLWIDRLR